MIKLLVKWFVKHPENVENSAVREEYCVLAGALGIICNLFLFGLKLIAGSLMGSIAIVSDAFNNLSDTGSSLVSLIGAKLSNKKPDREHPFGHGRFEYISSLIVSFIIMLVGFELLKSSASKIFRPEAIDFNPVLIVILCVSVPVKMWMFGYNKYIGKRISSGVLLAAAKDSINDVIATSAVIFTAVIGRFVSFDALDGIVGTVVSLMIIYSGFQISKDTIGLLLGTTPDPEIIRSIHECLMSADGIEGVHDLIVHDYGPGRVVASVHAEVPDDYDIVKIHEIIDELERRIEHDLGIHMVIHMDPISVNCERTSEIKAMVVSAVKEIDERMNIHDFRMTDGTENINLIFDLEVPVDINDSEKMKKLVSEKLYGMDARFNTVINIDTVYV